VELRAEGKKIVGDAVVTSKQLSRIIGFAEGWLDSMQSRRAPQSVPPGGATAAPAAAPTTRPASSGAMP
jgi:hypothetical protein